MNYAGFALGQRLFLLSSRQSNVTPVILTLHDGLAVTGLLSCLTSRKCFIAMRHVTLSSVNSIKVPRGLRIFASKFIGMGNARLQARPSKGSVQHSSRSGTAADDVSRSANDQLSGSVRKLDLPSGAQLPKDRCALRACTVCSHCCCTLLSDIMHADICHVIG